jgi:hypothetical protein
MSVLTRCCRCRVTYPVGEAACPECGWPASSPGRCAIVLRWLAVLPVALLVAFVLLKLAGGLTGVAWHHTEAVYLVPAAWSFVHVGARVAPKAHPLVPFSLATLYAAGVVATVSVYLRTPHLAFEPGASLAIVSLLGAAGVAFTAAVYVVFGRAIDRINGRAGARGGTPPPLLEPWDDDVR